MKMKSYNRNLFITLALLLLGSAWLGQPAPTGAQGPTIAWGTVPSPNRGTRQNLLKGIAAVSTDNIWAVGEWNPNVTPTETGRRTLTEHWDGSTWQIVDSPNPTWQGLDLATLEDVAAVSANGIWAVGYSQDFATLRSNTLIEHWDGTSWQIVPSPNPAGLNGPNELYGVAAVSTNDVWAVGSAGTDSRSLIVHWNGTSWSAVRNGCGRYADLRGITAISATDIWAVGDATTCHFDGTSWSLVASPQPRPQFDEIGYPLEDVEAVSATDIWAVGARVIDNVKSITFQSIVEHGNGTEWTIDYDLPGATLYGLEAISANDVWAVGTHSVGTLIVHWDGQEWSTVPTPDPGNGGDLLAIDAVTADDLWAAGAFLGDDYDSQTLILQAPSDTQGAVVGDTNVSGAIISWFGPASGSTTTNSFGEYEAAGLPAGSYTFIASASGCDPDVATVTVIAGTTVVQDFQLGC